MACLLKSFFLKEEQFLPFTENTTILLSIKTPTLKYEKLEKIIIRNAHPDLFWFYI